jgi:hypothetical protein
MTWQCCKRVVIGFFFVLVLLLQPTIALAQPAGGAAGAGGGSPAGISPGNLSDCDPTGEEGTNLVNCFALNQNQAVAEVYNQPATMVNFLVQNIFVIAGVILFGMIIYGGFQYISGGKNGAENARGIFTTAGIGFLMMFAAYWIVQIVQAMTGTEILL